METNTTPISGFWMHSEELDPEFFNENKPAAAPEFERKDKDYDFYPDSDL
jgi:hypothetical protein